MNNSIVLTILLVLGSVVSLKSMHFFLNKLGRGKNVSIKRTFYVAKFLSFLMILGSLFLLAIIWSMSLSGILIFASSIFTVVGVALFAQWSILSNITASIVIFFSFPARVGDRIQILDSDHSVEGKIVEIALFYIEIIDDNGDIILYPNNLFIQKPIKQLHNK